MTYSSPDQGIGKVCKECKQPPSETVVFGLHKYPTKDGVKYYERSTCQACEAKIAREYVATNKDKRAAAKKKHREKYFGTIRYHVQEKIATWRKASCVPSDLTVEYLIDLYNHQDGYCFYSDEKMVFGWVDGKVHHNSLSLDKLDPAKGYVQGNVVWCTYLVNTMKQDMTEQQFYDTINHIFDTTYGVTMPEITVAQKLQRIKTHAILGNLSNVVEEQCVPFAEKGQSSHTIYFYEGPDSLAPFFGSLGDASKALWKKISGPSFGNDTGMTSREFRNMIVLELEKETGLNISIKSIEDRDINGHHYYAPLVSNDPSTAPSAVLIVSW